MGLTDAYKAEARRRRSCRTRDLLAEMPPAEADELRRIFETGDVNYSALSRGLRSIGFPVSVSSLERHGKGLCSCD